MMRQNTNDVTGVMVGLVVILSIIASFSMLIGRAFGETDTVSGDTHFVSPSGANVSPYSSPANAASSIQDAIDVADDGDTVLVAKGTYRITSEISVTKAVTLRGIDGAPSTIVDGGNSNRCFKLAHPGAVLEGLTITRGHNETGGAGVYSAGGTIRSCVIRENDCGDSSGGGILVHGSLTIQDSTISSNRSCVGGGIEVRGTLVMDTCIVSGNVARVDAGGLECGTNTVIRNSVFVDNIAGRNGAGIDTSYRSALSMENSALRGNKAMSSVISHGGALHVTGTASANLRTCTISRNSSGHEGGGVFNRDHLDLVDCAVEQNSAISEGGGIFNRSGRSARTENCRIKDNSAAKGPDISGEVVAAGTTQIGSSADCTILREVAGQ